MEGHACKDPTTSLQEQENEMSNNLHSLCRRVSGGSREVNSTPFPATVT